MSTTLSAHPSKAPTLSDTTIAVWQERDRLHICLSRKSDDKTLVEWWDDDARQAIEDGFLSLKEAILGSLERNIKQGGALHKSAFEYWDAYIKVDH